MGNGIDPLESALKLFFIIHLYTNKKRSHRMSHQYNKQKRSSNMGTTKRKNYFNLRLSAKDATLDLKIDPCDLESNDVVVEDSLNREWLQLLIISISNITVQPEIPLLLEWIHDNATTFVVKTEGRFRLIETDQPIVEVSSIVVWDCLMTIRSSIISNITNDYRNLQSVLKGLYRQIDDVDKRGTTKWFTYQEIQRVIQHIQDRYVNLCELISREYKVTDEVIRRSINPIMDHDNDLMDAINVKIHNFLLENNTSFNYHDYIQLLHHRIDQYHDLFEKRNFMTGENFFVVLRHSMKLDKGT